MHDWFLQDYEHVLRAFREHCGIRAQYGVEVSVMVPGEAGTSDRSRSIALRPQVERISFIHYGGNGNPPPFEFSFSAASYEGISCIWG
jgi:hypothetical protein